MLWRHLLDRIICNYSLLKLRPAGCSCHLRISEKVRVSHKLSESKTLADKVSVATGGQLRIHITSSNVKKTHMKSQVRTQVKHKQIANETFAIAKETQRIRIYVCRKQLTQDAYKTQIDFVYFLRSPKNNILFLENKILFSWLHKKNHKQSAN